MHKSNGVTRLRDSLTCLALLQISLALAQTPAERGAALLQSRQVSQCLLCHAAPVPNPHLQGNLAPTLVGVGAKYTPAQLRERIAHPQRFNPQTVMPRYGEPSPAERVGAAHVGKAILTSEQLDDVVAFLSTSK